MTFEQDINQTRTIIKRHKQEGIDAIMHDLVKYFRAIGLPLGEHLQEAIRRELELGL